jgi:hypothetical protein
MVILSGVGKLLLAFSALRQIRAQARYAKPIKSSARRS